MAVATVNGMKERVGREVGVSEWILVDQKMIDSFADLTGDHQFIHVDPEAAARTPLGGTIAHGFLTLALLSQMAERLDLIPAEAKMALNYGFDRVRFLTPVRSGRRIRGRFTLTGFDEKRPGEWQVSHEVVVEIEGEVKPALAAAWVGLAFF